MNFTLKQLRAFLTVADTESFNLAAKRLNLTPGAVSLVIKELEQEIGFALFDRTTRSVALSKAGRDFWPAAERVLQELQSAMLTAQKVQNMTTGVVRVAAPLVVASALLPPALATYRKAKPGVQIRLLDCAVEDLVQAVEEDYADIAVGPNRATDERVERIALYKTPWVLWCAAANPLVKRKKITWASLASQPDIFAGRDYVTHLADPLPYLPPGQHVVPNYLVKNLSTALGLAASDIAVTFCPAYVAVLAQSFGLVMRLIEEPEIICEMSVYVPRNRALTPTALAFVEFLKPFLIEQASAALERMRSTNTTLPSSSRHKTVLRASPRSTVPKAPRSA